MCQLPTRTREPRTAQRPAPKAGTGDATGVGVKPSEGASLILLSDPEGPITQTQRYQEMQRYQVTNTMPMGVLGGRYIAILGYLEPQDELRV